MEYEVGDIVGWYVDVLHRNGEPPTVMQGLVVAIDGDFLCVRALHIVAAHQDPFVGRHRNYVHLIQKKAA
jgi:hypothetical protein